MLLLSSSGAFIGDIRVNLDRLFDKARYVSLVQALDEDRVGSVGVVVVVVVMLTLL